MVTIHVDIVSAEKEIFSGEAEMVFAPAILGEVGIAPGHTPMVTQLAPGEVRIKQANGEEEGFYVSGGMLEVQPDVVTVLSDTAMRAEDLDEAAVLKAREEAERELHDRNANIDYAMTLAKNAEAVAQLQAIRRMRKRTGRYLLIFLFLPLPCYNSSMGTGRAHTVESSLSSFGECRVVAHGCAVYGPKDGNLVETNDSFD